jgi:hypothetical protein
LAKMAAQLLKKIGVLTHDTLTYLSALNDTFGYQF